MSETVFTILSWLCFLGGGFFLFVGSLGMIRLRDFWARLHAASIIDSAGVGLIIAGMMFQTGLTLVTVKFAIIVMFLMITGPTATHAVANAAYVSGLRPENMVSDETENKKTKPVKSVEKQPSTSSRSGTNTARGKKN